MDGRKTANLDDLTPLYRIKRAVAGPNKHKRFRVKEGQLVEYRKLASESSVARRLNVGARFFKVNIQHRSAAIRFVEEDNCEYVKLVRKSRTSFLSRATGAVGSSNRHGAAGVQVGRGSLMPKALAEQASAAAAASDTNSDAHASDETWCSQEDDDEPLPPLPTAQEHFMLAKQDVFGTASQFASAQKGDKLRILSPSGNGWFMVENTITKMYGNIHEKLLIAVDNLPDQHGQNSTGNSQVPTVNSGNDNASPPRAKKRTTTRTTRQQSEGSTSNPPVSTELSSSLPTGQLHHRPKPKPRKRRNTSSDRAEGGGHAEPTRRSSRTGHKSSTPVSPGSPDGYAGSQPRFTFSRSVEGILSSGYVYDYHEQMQVNVPDGEVVTILASQKNSSVLVKRSNGNFLSVSKHQLRMPSGFEIPAMEQHHSSPTADLDFDDDHFLNSGIVDPSGTAWDTYGLIDNTGGQHGAKYLAINLYENVHIYGSAEPGLYFAQSFSGEQGIIPEQWVAPRASGLLATPTLQGTPNRTTVSRGSSGGILPALFTRTEVDLDPFEMELDKFKESPHVSLLAIHSTLAPLQLRPQDWKRILTITKDTLSSFDHNPSAFSCLLSILIEIQRSPENLRSKIVSSQEYKALIQLASQQAMTLSSGFHKGILGNDETCEGANELKEALGNQSYLLLGVISNLLQQLREETIRVSFAVIAIDLWMCTLFWKERCPSRWQKYIQHLRLGRMDAATFINYLQYYCNEHFLAVNLNIQDLMVFTEKFVVEANDTSLVNARQVWDFTVYLNLNSDSDVCTYLDFVISKWKMERNMTAVLAKILCYAATQPGLGTHAALQFILKMDCGNNFQRVKSILDNNVRKEVQESKKSLFDQAISKAFSLYCLRKSVRCSLQELTDALRENANTCASDFAVQYLHGKDINLVKDQTPNKEKQLLSLIESVASSYLNVALLADYSTLVAIVHKKLGFNVVATAKFIRQSCVLRRDNSTRDGLEQGCRLTLNQKQSLKEEVNQALDVILVLSGVNVVCRPGSACGLLWLEYCRQTTKLFQQLLSNGSDWSNQMTELAAIPARIRRQGNSSVMEAIYYSSILGAVARTAKGQHALQLGNMLKFCCQAYRRAPDDAWLEPHMSDFVKLQGNLEGLNQRLQDGQYSVTEHRKFSSILTELNRVFKACQQPELLRLPLDPNHVIHNLEECRQFLDWLSSREVGAADKAVQEIEQIRNDSDATLPTIKSLVDKWRSTFEGGLHGTIASNCNSTPFDFILHFSGKNSQLFNVLTRAGLGSLADDSDDWSSRIQRLLRRAHYAFVAVLDGSIEYRMLSQHIQSQDKIDWVLELTTIRDFPPYADLCFKPAGPVQPVAVAMEVIQHFRNDRVNNVVRALTKLDVVEESDPDMKYLTDICEECLEEVGALSRFGVGYTRLHKLFSILRDGHFQLFAVIAKGDCDNILKFFGDYHSPSGREAFHNNRDLLNMQLHRDGFDNEILMSLMETWEILNPFFSFSQKETLQKVLETASQVPINDVGSLNTTNQHAGYISELFQDAAASSTEATIKQLEGLTGSGHLVVDLHALACKRSTFCYLYTPATSDMRQAASATSSAESSTALAVPAEGGAQKRVVMDAQEVKHFRSNLHYLQSLQEAERSAHRQSRNINELARKCAATLQVAGDVYTALSDLERQGHPEFQDRDLKLLLSEQKLKSQLDQLNDKAREWDKELEVHRGNCPFLRLFTNQDLATILALLSPEPRAGGSNAQRTAINKLTDTSRTTPDARSSDSWSLPAKLIEMYVRYISSAARLRDTVNLHADICFIFKQAEPEWGHKILSFKRLLNIVFESPLQSPDNARGHQLICASKGAESGFINVFRLLCTIYLIKEKSLPCAAQVVFCTKGTTKTDLEAFFQRVLAFPRLVFTIVAPELLGYNERSILLEKQREFSVSHGNHATIYYVCLDQTTCSHWPSPYVVDCSLEAQDIGVCTNALSRLLRTSSAGRPEIIMVLGESGDGKSHYIRTQMATAQSKVVISITSCVTRAVIIRRLTSLQPDATVFFNLSREADVDAVNHMFFELLVCGTLTDLEFSSVFALPQSGFGTWFVEVSEPDIEQRQLHCQESAGQNLYESARERYPMLCLLAKARCESSDLDALKIGPDERRLAATINLHWGKNKDSPSGYEEWKLDESSAVDDESCRRSIQQLLRDTQLSGEAKVQRVAFLCYLRRQLHHYDEYLFKTAAAMTYFNLICATLRQFVSEARYLSTPNLPCVWQKCTQYFCFFGPSGNFNTFGPPEHLQENDAIGSTMLQTVDSKTGQTVECPLLHLTDKNGKPGIPEPAEYLQWIFGISPAAVQWLIERKRFVLTMDFAYKLLLIHRRKQTRLPLIIEGDTGVGKTFLLEMYTELLYHAKYHSTEDTTALRLRPRCCGVVRAVMDKHLSSAVMDDEERARFMGLDKQLRREDFKHPKELGVVWREVLRMIDSAASRKNAMAELFKEILSIIKNFPLLVISDRVEELTKNPAVTEEESEELLITFLGSSMKKLFEKKLIHPGLTNESLQEFMQCPRSVARTCREQDVVVFFDEVNTSTCLGIFKEMLVDRTLDGVALEDNIFFVCAINPHLDHQNPAEPLYETKRYAASDVSQSDTQSVSSFQQVYAVRELPPAMKKLTWIYESLCTDKELQEYVRKKITLQKDNLIPKIPGSRAVDITAEQTRFTAVLINAHMFCLKWLGKSSVSQRDIHRVFVLLRYFWRVEEILLSEWGDGELINYSHLLRKSITLAIAVVYYFRLESGVMEGDGREAPSRTSAEGHHPKVCRQDLQHFLHLENCEPESFVPGTWKTCLRCKSDDHEEIHDLKQAVQSALDAFVTRKHFKIPDGIALTNALMENIFCIVACVQTRIPLGIVGDPGSSKTLSYNIVRENLRGKQSGTAFCQKFVAIDTFFYQCSEQSTSPEIAAMFNAAIDRQKYYDKRSHPSQEESYSGHFSEDEQSLEDTGSFGTLSSQASTHCVVFLDEAGLPTEEKMVLKVLHPYLDEREVAFVALSNCLFDLANANRMVTAYRSQAEHGELVKLCTGCIKSAGPDQQQAPTAPREEKFIDAVCHAYRRVTGDPVFKKMFHHRDLIYLMRHLRRHQQFTRRQHISSTPAHLLRALEENFGGMPSDDFRRLVNTFFSSVAEHYCEDEFPSAIEQSRQCSTRNTIVILRHINQQAKEAQNRPSLRTGNPLAPRFTMIIDPTDDLSSLSVMQQLSLLDPDSTHVIHMSSLPDDEDELHSAEVLSQLRLHMETACTVVLVNTKRIHGSLYELLNQTFRIFHRAGEPRIYANLAVGGKKTFACCVHPQFRCMVIIKHTDVDSTAAPFLSRFSKFFLAPGEAMAYVKCHVLPEQASCLRQVINSCERFVTHIGKQNFYGFNAEQSLPLLLLSHMQQAGEERYTLVPFTNTTEKVRDQFKTVPSEVLLAARGLRSRLLQLLPTEHYVLNAGSLGCARDYRKIYFEILEHFSLRAFIRAIRSNMSGELRGLASSVGVVRVRKFMLYTQSLLAVAQIKADRYFGNMAEKLAILDTSTVHRYSELEQFLDVFVQSSEKSCVMLLVDSSCGNASTANTAFFKHIIDRYASAPGGANGGSTTDKMFILLLHAPSYIAKKAYPCPFLQDWDCQYMDLAGGVDTPLLSVKALATSHNTQGVALHSMGEEVDYAHEDVKLQRLAESLKQGMLSNNSELARVFCSRLAQVSAPTDELLTLSDQLKTVYSAMAGHSTQKISVAKRSEAVAAILRDHDEILEEVGRRLLQRLTPDRSARLLQELAKFSVQRKTLLNFPDLVEMHIRPDAENILQKVLLTLCQDFGLSKLQLTTLSQPVVSALLSLIPRFSIQDERRYSQHACSISCSQHAADTLLFSQIKRRMEKLFNEINKHTEARPLKRLHENVVSDEALVLLLDQDSFLKSYMRDLIKVSCKWSGSDQAVNTAMLFLDLKFLEEGASAPDRLSHMHHVLKVELMDVRAILYACRTLKKLSDDSEEHLAVDVSILSRQKSSMDLLEALMQNLFDRLWKQLFLVTESDSWFLRLKTWRQNYRFVTLFFKPSNFKCALEAIYEKQSPQVCLMEIADIFFSVPSLSNNLPVAKNFLDVLKDLHQGQERSRRSIIEQVMAALKSARRRSDEELHGLFLRFLKHLIRSIPWGKPENNAKDISFCFSAINNTAEHGVELSFEAAKQLFKMLSGRLQPARGSIRGSDSAERGRTGEGSRQRKTLPQYLSNYVSKELEQHHPSATQCLGEMWTSALYIPSLYRPRHCHDGNGGHSSEDMKAMFDMQLAHVFFDFISQSQLNKNEELMSLLSDANLDALYSFQPSSKPVLSSGLVLRLAACTEAVFRQASEEICRIVPQAIAGNLSGFADLQGTVQSLFDQHVRKHPAWLELFVSHLVYGAPIGSLLKFLSVAEYQWAAECREMVSKSDPQEKPSFSFVTHSRCSDAMLSDDTSAAYRDFEAEFAKSVAEKSNFRRLKQWYSGQAQHGAAAAAPPHLDSTSRAEMFIFLKVYHDYFLKKDMSTVQALTDMPCSHLLQTCLKLLSDGCPLELDDMKRIFHSKNVCTPELQDVRTIFIHCIAYVLGSRRPGNHLTVCMLSPKELQSTLLFGAVNHRSCIDPGVDGVKVDCCAQFDENGKPAGLAKSALFDPVALGMMGKHLNSLLMFSCLCLHCVVSPSTAAEALRTILSVDQVHSECGNSSAFLTQALQFCLHRVLQLFHLLRRDNQFAKPGSTIKVVVASLERLLSLQSRSQANILLPLYDGSSQMKRHLAEVFYQREVVDYSCRSLRKLVLHPALVLDSVLSYAKSCGAEAEGSNSPILCYFLERLDQFENLQFVLNIAKFYTSFHQSLNCRLNETESQTFSFKEAHDLLKSQQERAKLRKLFELAKGDFNSFHKAVSGILQVAVCGTKVELQEITNSTPVADMVSLVDEKGILFRVIEDMIDHQNRFLAKCEEVKAAAPTSALKHALDAGEFDESMSMNQVVHQLGAGLLNVQREDVEQICLMHSFPTTDADGERHTEFKLAAIEQAVIQEFINSARRIGLEDFRIPFSFKDQSSHDILNLAPLSDKLPGDGFSEELDTRCMDAIKDSMKNYKDSIASCKCLVIVSEKVVAMIQKPGDVDSIANRKLHDFLLLGELQEMSEPLTAVSCSEPIKLGHLRCLFTTIWDYLMDGHEYLYMHIPEQLRKGMAEGLNTVTDDILRNFFQDLMVGAEKKLQIADDAVSVLQDAVTFVQKAPDASLIRTLRESDLITDVKYDVFCKIPEEVCGMHLKALMVKLVKVGCRAREEEFKTMPDKETCHELDEEIKHGHERAHETFYDTAMDYDSDDADYVYNAVERDDDDGGYHFGPGSDDDRRGSLDSIEVRVFHPDSNPTVVEHDSAQVAEPRSSVGTGEPAVDSSASAYDHRRRPSSDSQEDQVSTLQTQSAQRGDNQSPNLTTPAASHVSSVQEQLHWQGVDVPFTGGGGTAQSDANDGSASERVACADDSFRGPLAPILARSTGSGGPSLVDCGDLQPYSEDEHDVTQSEQHGHGEQATSLAYKAPYVQGGRTAPDENDEHLKEMEVKTVECHQVPVGSGVYGSRRPKVLSTVDAKLSDEVNADGLRNSDLPCFIVVPTLFPEHQPFNDVAKAVRGRLTRNVIYCEGDVRKQCVRLGEYRKQVLKSACKLMGLQHSSVVLAHQNGYVLRDDEDPVKESDRSSHVYCLLDVASTVMLDVQVKEASDMSEQRDSVRVQVLRSASSTLICQAVLHRLSRYPTPTRAVLCDSRGAVLDGEYLALSLQNAEIVTVYLHIGKGQLAAFSNVEVPALCLPPSGTLLCSLECSMSEVVQANSVLCPSVERVEFVTGVEQPFYIVDSSAMRYVSVQHGEQQLTLHLVDQVTVESLRLMACRAFGLQQDSESVVCVMPDEGLVQILPNKALLIHWLQPAFPEDRTYLSIMAPTVSTVFKIDVSCFKMTCNWAIGTTEHSVGGLIQYLCDRFSTQECTQAESLHLVDSSTLCTLNRKDQLSPLLPQMPEEALRLVLYALCLHLNIVERNPAGSEVRSVSLEAYRDIRVVHLLGKIQILPEFSHLFQQPHKVQLVTLDGVHLPPECRLRELCEHSALTLKVGIVSPEEMCYFKVAFSTKKQGDSSTTHVFLSMERTTYLRQLLSYCRDQLLERDVAEQDACQLLFPDRYTVQQSSEGSVADLVAKLGTWGQPDQPIPCLLQVIPPASPWPCAPSLSDVTPVSICLSSQEHDVLKFIAPKAMKYSHFHRHVTSYLGLSNSADQCLFEVEEVTEVDDGDGEMRVVLLASCSEDDDEESGNDEDSGTGDEGQIRTLQEMNKRYKLKFFIRAPHGTHLEHPESSVLLDNGIIPLEVMPCRRALGDDEASNTATPTEQVSLCLSTNPNVLLSLSAASSMEFTDFYRLILISLGLDHSDGDVFKAKIVKSTSADHSDDGDGSDEAEELYTIPGCCGDDMSDDDGDQESMDTLARLGKTYELNFVITVPPDSTIDIADLLLARAALLNDGIDLGEIEDKRLLCAEATNVVTCADAAHAAGDMITVTVYSKAGGGTSAVIRVARTAGLGDFLALATAQLNPGATCVSLVVVNKSGDPFPIELEAEELASDIGGLIDGEQPVELAFAAT